MWQAGTYLLIIASLGVTLSQLRVFDKDWISKFVILMIWSRFSMAALGPSAIETSFAGFSLMALSTLAMTGIGILVVPLDYFRSSKVTPFYGLIGLGVLGGLMNGGGVELVSYVIIWAFFLVCVLLLYRALLIQGHQRVLRCLLSAFSLPLGMQFLSVLLSNPKVGPDGSLSYIGGYAHEAAYALVLISALWIIAIFPWPRPRIAWGVFTIALAGLVLANYRTLIVAAAPILLAFLAQHTGSNRNTFVRLILILGLGLALVLPNNSFLAGGRFEEIGTVTSEIETLAKPPEEFTAREKDILSARLHIWSRYLSGSLKADIPDLLIGHGPGARPYGITVHAHNEYLRILFENGVMGLILWLGLMIRQLKTAMVSVHASAGLIVTAGFFAIFLGALGTSIFNRPEGMIFFALVCSANWYLAALKLQPGRNLEGLLHLPSPERAGARPK